MQRDKLVYILVAVALILAGLGIAFPRAVVNVAGSSFDGISDALHSLGAATMSRTGESSREGVGTFDNTTSTFAYWKNNTGGTVVIKRIDMSFDPDLSAGPQKASPVLIIATSTSAGGTSTIKTAELAYESFTTSTAFQFISTSTFTQVWQRQVENGVYVVFGWLGKMGASTTPYNYNTPSSTGAFSIQYFIK